MAAYLLSYLLPFESNIPLIALAFGSVAIAYSSSSRSKSISPVYLGLLAVFMSFTAIAISASEDVSHSLFTSMPFLPAILIFSLVVTCFRTAKDIFRLYSVLSLLSMGLCLILLRELFGAAMESSTDWINRAATPLLVVPNDALLFSLIMPLSLVQVLKSPRSYSAALAGVSILLALTVIVLLESRVATLVAGASFLLVLFSYFRFKQAVYAVLVACLVIVALDGLTGFNLLHKFANIQDPRFALWVAAWDMFMNKPWLGYGPHTFVFHYQDFLPLNSGLMIEERTTPWAHNLYLELLAEQGILVSSAFVLLISFNLYRAWKLSWHNRALMLAGLGVATSLTGFLLAGGIELSFIRIWVVLILFVLLAVIHNLSTYSPESPNNE